MMTGQGKTREFPGEFSLLDVDGIIWVKFGGEEKVTVTFCRKRPSGNSVQKAPVTFSPPRKIR